MPFLALGHRQNVPGCGVRGAGFVGFSYCIVWYKDGEDDIRDKPEAENSSVTSEKLQSLLQIPEPRRHFRSRAKCPCSRSNQRQPHRHPHPLKRRLAHRSFPSPNLVCGVLGEQPAGGEDEGFEVPTGKRPHPGRSSGNPVEVASASRESVLQRGAVGWRGRGHSSGIRRQERIHLDVEINRPVAQARRSSQPNVVPSTTLERMFRARPRDPQFGELSGGSSRSSHGARQRLEGELGRARHGRGCWTICGVRKNA